MVTPRAGSSLAETRPSLRASLRLAWLAAIVAIAGTVVPIVLIVVVTLMSPDLGFGFKFTRPVGGSITSIIAWILLAACVARTGSMKDDRTFQFVRTTAITVLILVLITFVATLMAGVWAHGFHIGGFLARRIQLLAPVLLLPLLAIMAHRINLAMGGRLFDRRTYIATLVVAGIAILVTSLADLSTILGPFAGSAAVDIGSLNLWFLEQLLFVWMLVVLSMSIRRLRDVRGGVSPAA